MDELPRQFESSHTLDNANPHGVFLVVEQEEDKGPFYAEDDKSLAAQIMRQKTKIRHFLPQEIARYQVQKPNMKQVIDLATVAKLNERRKSNWAQLEKELNEKEHKTLTVGQGVDLEAVEKAKGDKLRRTGTAEMKMPFISDLFRHAIAFENSPSWVGEVLVFIKAAFVDERSYNTYSDRVQVPEVHDKAFSAYSSIQTKREEFCTRYERVNETRNSTEFTLYGELLKDTCRLLHAVTVDHIVKSSYVEEIYSMTNLMIIYGDSASASRILLRLGLYFFEASKFYAIEGFNDDKQNLIVKGLCKEAHKALALAVDQKSMAAKSALENLEAFESVDMQKLIEQKYPGLASIAEKNIKVGELQVDPSAWIIDLDKKSFLERLEEYFFNASEEDGDLQADDGLNGQDAAASSLLTQSVMMLGSSVAQELQVITLLSKLEDKQQIALKLIYGVRNTDSDEQYKAYAHFVGTAMMFLKCMLDQNIIKRAYVSKLEEVCAICEGFDDINTSIYINASFGRYFLQVARAFEAKSSKEGLSNEEMVFMRQSYDEARSFCEKVIELQPQEIQSTIAFNELSDAYQEQLFGVGRRILAQKADFLNGQLKAMNVADILPLWKGTEAALHQTELAPTSWDIDEVAYEGGMPYSANLLTVIRQLSDLEMGISSKPSVKEIAESLDAIQSLGDTEVFNALLKRLVDILENQGQVIYKNRMINWYSEDERSSMANIYETILVVLTRLRSSMLEEYLKSVESYKSYFSISPERMEAYKICEVE